PLPPGGPASTPWRHGGGASAAAWSSGAGVSDGGAARVLRAGPGWLARLPDPSPPALHGLAPGLRRDRRDPRAAFLLRPLRRSGCSLLPSARNRRARARRTAGPAPADADPGANAAGVDRDLAGRRRRDRDRRGDR